MQTAGADPDDAVPAEAPAVATVAYGTHRVSCSPQDPALLGRTTADLPISAAWAVASLDPVLRPLVATPTTRQRYAGLAVAPAAEAEMQPVDIARAVAGRGLEGDRYAAGAGTFTPRGGHRPGYDLTLVAAKSSTS